MVTVPGVRPGARLIGRQDAGDGPQSDSPPRRIGITIDQATYRLARATGADTESFHLQRVREAFAGDLLDIDRLERAIEHVLRGGYLDENFLLRAPVMDRVRRRRRQRDCPHADVYELLQTGHAGVFRTICVDCGASEEG